MKKVVVVKFCLTLILLGLFFYMSWRTLIKYQAEKTSLQVDCLKTFYSFHFFLDRNLPFKMYHFLPLR